jgi:hypothetical protein
MKASAAATESDDEDNDGDAASDDDDDNEEREEGTPKRSVSNDKQQQQAAVMVRSKEGQKVVATEGASNKRINTNDNSTANINKKKGLSLFTQISNTQSFNLTPLSPVCYFRVTVLLLCITHSCMTNGK